MHDGVQNRAHSPQGPRTCRPPRKRSPDHPVVEQWLGISTDEIIRAKPSFESWQVKRFPLIEMRMSRSDCLAWLKRHDYPLPPKSACIACPFHDDTLWRHMRDHDAEAWAMPSRSTAPSVPVCAAFAGRSSCIAQLCHLTRRTCLRRRIMASSTSGQTSARACAVSDACLDQTAPTLLFASDPACVTASPPERILGMRGNYPERVLPPPKRMACGLGGRSNIRREGSATESRRTSGPGRPSF